MRPSLSVLMAAHNAADFIEESIESLLAQTYTDFEIILVLDAPTDATPEKIARFQDPRLKVFTNESNLGLTKSLNVGLRHCQGEWVARQDADDISCPDRFEKQMAYLAAHPECALVGSSTYLIDEKKKVLGVHEVPCTDPDIRWQMFFENAFVHTSVIFKAKVVNELGGYDESFTRTQDFDLWSRVLRKYSAGNILEPLVFYRHHSQSISSRQADKSNYYGDIVVEAYVKEMGLPQEWAKSLSSIRHTYYTVETTESLWKTLKVIPQLRDRLIQKLPELKSSAFVKERIPTYFRFIAEKSAGIDNRLSFAALYEMLKYSPSSLINFSFPRWAARVLLGQRAFAELKLLIRCQSPSQLKR